MRAAKKSAGMIHALVERKSRMERQKNISIVAANKFGYKQKQAKSRSIAGREREEV